MRAAAEERSGGVDDQRAAPDLEEMDEQQARGFLEALMADLGAESGYEVRHEDFAMEMPQSGERIRGRERMREFQAAFGGAAPAMRLRRVMVREGLWVGEVVSDYGGREVHYVSIVELKDGKMWRDTRYYAEPFEAPEWRAHLVERMEP
jgi:hypothetical protein